MRQGSERYTGSQWANKSCENIELPTLTLYCLSRIRRQGSVAGCTWLMGLLASKSWQAWSVSTLEWEHRSAAP